MLRCLKERFFGTPFVYILLGTFTENNFHVFGHPSTLQLFLIRRRIIKI